MIAEQWDDIAASLREAPPVRETPAAALIDPVSARIARLAKAASRDQTLLQPSFNHGDLHLSHVILNAHGCRIIDPANDVTADTLVDHALADLFQLYRGIECFAFDEAATWLANGASITRDAAAACLLSTGVGGSAHVARVADFARIWPTILFRHVVRGYRSAASTALSTPLDDPVWCELFYMSRLLHEIAYNIRYDRLFFRLSDQFHLARYAAGDPPGHLGRAAPRAVEAP